MDSLRYFGWLASEAFGGLLYLWSVSAGLLAILAAAVFVEGRSGRLRISDRIGFLALPFVGAVFILACGALFERQAELWPLPFAGLGFSFALAGLCVFRRRDIWMTASTVSLCSLWYSLWCSFVSAMSISGDWL